MGNVMNQPNPNENLTLALRRMHRWRMAFFGLVLMISGSILGAATTMLVLRPKDRRPGPPDPGQAAIMMTLRLKEELGLSAEQEGKIEKIFKTQLEKLEEIRETARPQIEAVMKITEDEIGKVLSEEQRKQLQGALEEMKRPFRRGMRSGRPGDFGDRHGPFQDREDRRGPGGRGRDWQGPGGPRGPWRGLDPNGPPPQPPIEEGPPIEPNEYLPLPTQ